MSLNRTLYFNSSNSTFTVGQEYLQNSSLSKAYNNTFLTNSFINTASTLKIAYYCIGSVGFVFNGFVAFVLFYVDKSSKGSNNTSAFHVKWQTCIDALVAIFLLATILKEDEVSIYSRGYFWDEMLCRVWFSKSPLWSSLVASTYSVIALNLDRYIAVIYPIFHKVKFSQNRKYSVILTLACTAVGPVYNLAYIIPSSGIIESNECSVYAIWPRPDLRSFVGILTLMVQFFFPLIVIILLYLKMMIALQVKVSPSQKTTDKTGLEEEQPVSTIDQFSSNKSEPKPSGTKARAKGKVLKTAGLLSISFVTCWSFNQFYFLMYQLNVGSLSLSGTFYHFTVIMVFANCCINPIVYSINFEPFQKNVKYLALKVKRLLTPK